MIVARSLTGLLYAWRLQEKCILVEPFCFHNLSDEFAGIDFKDYNVQNSEQFMASLITIMSITSLLLHYGNVASFREEDKTIITKGNNRIEIKEDVEIFDGKDLDENQVFDEFYWRAGTQHILTKIKGDDDFCKTIYFYPSERQTVHNSVKDFIVASIMTNSQLLDPDYGNGMVRIKTQRMFKENGLKGDYAWTRGETRYYKAIKFDFVDRIVVPRIEQKMSFKEVFNMEQKEGKEWKMWKRLMSREKTWLG